MLFWILSLLFTYFALKLLKIYYNYRFIASTGVSHNTENLKNRFQEKKLPEKIDAIVIGSGVGGLGCAAHLAEAGKRVLVLEKHTVAGGTMHTYERQGYEFDTGIHYLGQMGKQYQYYHVMNSVADGKIDFYNLHGGSTGLVYDELQMGEDIYEFEAGKKRYVSNLYKWFPDEKQAIDQFVTMIYDCSMKMNFYESLKVLPRWLSNIVEKFFATPFTNYSKKTLKEVLDTLTTNPKLYAVLAHPYGVYGDPPNKGSFAMHAAALVHYISGAYYPQKGPMEPAKRWTSFIVKKGGRVLVAADVTQILFEGDTAVGVLVHTETKDVTIRAPLVISACSSKITYGQLLPKELRERNHLMDLYKDIPHSLGHIMVMLVLDGEAKDFGITAANYWNLYDYDVDKITTDYPTTLKIPGLFASFPTTKNPELEAQYPNKTIAIVMTEGGSFEWYKKWVESEPRHRDSDYDSFKKQFVDQTMEILYKRFPRIKDHIVFMETGSPLSTLYYISSPEGSSYGLSGVPKRFEHWSDFTFQTPFQNLYICGQDISFFPT